MQRELDALLCSRYPRLFRDRRADMSTTAMCWGFSCGDGWFHLIDALCDEIQRHVKTQGAEFENAIRVRQVKEKYGTLHFYTPGDDHIDGLIWMADAISDRICEECGAPGVLNTKGWWETRCDEHRGYELPKPEQIADDEDDEPDDHLTLAMPPVRNPGWQHLADRLRDAIEHDMEHNRMPTVVIDAVIETETLSYRWRGGNEKTTGFFALIEALSLRTDPVSGKPRTP